MAAATAVFAPASATAQLLLHRRRSRSRRIYSCGPAIALARLSSSLCGGVRQRPISPSCGYGRAPLVPASDNWGNWTFLLSTAALGTWSEKRSPVGKALTGALVSLLLGLAASSAGVVAAGATACRVALDYLLPLAIPLLLFRADLRRRRRGVFRSSGALLVAFLHGSGTGLSIIFLRRAACHAISEDLPALRLLSQRRRRWARWWRSGSSRCGRWGRRTAGRSRQP